MAGRHQQGRHRRRIEPWDALRAAALATAVLTLVAVLVPNRNREAAQKTTADAQTSLALPPAAPTSSPTTSSSASVASATASTPPPPPPQARTTPTPPRPRPVAPAPTPRPLRLVEDAQPANSTFGARFVAGARPYIGVPYLWGGTTSAGMDCSGLVQTVLRALGKNPPRTADQQMRWSTRITRAQAGEGDLVFGLREDGTAQHVGIFLGGNQMIDAPLAGGSIGVHNLYVWPATVFGRVP